MNSNDIDQTVSNNNNDDQEHPTQEPFTAPDNPNNPNKKLLPLAAIGGFFIEVGKKVTNICNMTNRK